MFWRKRSKREGSGVVSDAWLVVGLGNPGPQYEATRHNVGQMALDVLADRIGARFAGHKTNSRVAEGFLRPGGPKLVLAKSNGYMNTSGGPVSALAKYFDVPAERIGWSGCAGDPTTGRVYAIGACGLLKCLDGDTGKTIWSHSLSEEFGLLSTYGGRTNVPVIFDDLAIISAVCTSWGDQARPVHRFMAFNKTTGELVWTNGTRPLPDDTTYSTPFLAVIKGQPLMVFGSGDGSVWAFQPRTGKPQPPRPLDGEAVPFEAEADRREDAQPAENDHELVHSGISLLANARNG